MADCHSDGGEAIQTNIQYSCLHCRNLLFCWIMWSHQSAVHLVRCHGEVWQCCGETYYNIRCAVHTQCNACTHTHTHTNTTHDMLTDRQTDRPLFLMSTTDWLTHSSWSPLHWLVRSVIPYCTTCSSRMHLPRTRLVCWSSIWWSRVLTASRQPFMSSWMCSSGGNMGITCAVYWSGTV